MTLTAFRYTHTHSHTKHRMYSVYICYTHTHTHTPIRYVVFVKESQMPTSSPWQIGVPSLPSTRVFAVGFSQPSDPKVGWACHYCLWVSAHLCGCILLNEIKTKFRNSFVAVSKNYFWAFRKGHWEIKE